MSKILIGLTGSIACFKVAGLISDLVKEGHEVRTIATPSALKFIGKATLEGLSGNPVHTELFSDGEHMKHIHMGRWADLFLIAPCTANTMAKIKIGLADDLLTSTALAFEKTKPVYIAPAMNKEMWSNIATQNSYEALSLRGFNFINPQSGDLACGEIGLGRLAEIDIIKNSLFQNKSKKILITGGGTRESIDGVRFVGNSSTGSTSLKLAQSLRAKGFEVDLLMAQESFTDFSSLEKVMKDSLQSKPYDAVIHAAAVSDYSVAKVKTSSYEGPANKSLKIKTDDTLNIEMTANPKILNNLKSWSINPDIQVVGFKLTQTEESHERQSAVSKVTSEGNTDFIIHNDLTEITKSSHPFNIIKNNEPLASVDGASALAEELSIFLGGAK